MEEQLCTAAALLEGVAEMSCLTAAMPMARAVSAPVRSTIRPATRLEAAGLGLGGAAPAKGGGKGTKRSAASVFDEAMAMAARVGPEAEERIGGLRAAYEVAENEANAHNAARDEGIRARKRRRREKKSAVAPASAPAPAAVSKADAAARARLAELCACDDPADVTQAVVDAAVAAAEAAEAEVVAAIAAIDAAAAEDDAAAEAADGDADMHDAPPPPPPANDWEAEERALLARKAELEAEALRRAAARRVALDTDPDVRRMVRELRTLETEADRAEKSAALCGKIVEHNAEAGNAAAVLLRELLRGGGSMLVDSLKAAAAAAMAGEDGEPASKAAVNAALYKLVGRHLVVLDRSDPRRPLASTPLAA